VIRRVVFLLVAVCAPFLAAEDPREIILRTAGRDQEDIRIRKDYTYKVLTEQRNLDKSGQVTKTESRTEEVLILYGRAYERLIARDGRPLSESQERKEREKMDKEIARRAKESPGQKEKRAREEAKALRQQEEILREVAGAFDFTLAGEETLDGFRAWVIQAEPKPGYRPRSRETRILPNVRAKLWITQDDYRWVKIDAEVIRSIRFGVVLARLNPGTTLTFEQQRVQGEIWMPRQADFRLSARLGLVKPFNAKVRMDFFDYRKFTSDSRVVSVEEIPAAEP
jgi:hypothetical protein